MTRITSATGESRVTHTPGPWHIKWNRVTVAILDEQDNYIVENVREQANQVANARLIAAAPELLEALQASLEWTAGTSVGDRSRAIIAKARGE